VGVGSASVDRVAEFAFWVDDWWGWGSTECGLEVIDVLVFSSPVVAIQAGYQIVGYDLEQQMFIVEKDLRRALMQVHCSQTVTMELLLL